MAADKLKILLMRAHIPFLGSVRFPELAAAITVSLPAVETWNDGFHGPILPTLNRLS